MLKAHRLQTKGKIAVAYAPYVRHPSAALPISPSAARAVVHGGGPVPSAVRLVPGPYNLRIGADKKYIAPPFKPSAGRNVNQLIILKIINKTHSEFPPGIKARSAEQSLTAQDRDAHRQER